MLAEERATAAGSRAAGGQARLESVLADDLTMGFIPMVAVPACVLVPLVGIVTLSRARTAQLFS